MGLIEDDAYQVTLHEKYVKGSLTNLTPEALRQAVSPDFPKVLNIEPTSACNLKCRWCPREKSGRADAFFPWELYERVIAELREQERLIMINFHKDGEPLLHDRLVDMVALAKKWNVSELTHLNTNALRLTPDLSSALVDSGLDDITVSIDASHPETFAKFKGADALERVERNVLNLLERRAAKNALNPYVRVKIIKFDGLRDGEVDDFLAKWTGKADFVQVAGMHTWSKSVQFHSTSLESRRRYPCPIPWHSLVVCANGDVTSCTGDWKVENNYGSLITDTLAGLWRSRKAREHRRRHLEGGIVPGSVCHDCSFWVPSGDMTDFLTTKRDMYAE